jgi:hypothetical protein
VVTFPKNAAKKISSAGRLTDLQNLRGDTPKKIMRLHRKHEGRAGARLSVRGGFLPADLMKAQMGVIMCKLR